MRKKVYLLLLIPLTALIITAILNRELISYGLDQLRGQLHIVMNAVPVEDVLQDPGTPDSIKEKLLLIGEIKKFAIDSLGLQNSKNYTSFYNQHGLPVLWVLTACKPFSMEAYDWYFPFLGAVSYKGFFKKEKGIPEDSILQLKGYDTEFAPTSGWSTLGWFRDPILSGMLRKKEGRLAELIIHELTHATVYLKGSVDFNENLATFIGEQGAIRFLKNKYGNSSAPLTQYLNTQEDENIFGNYMVQACKELEIFYQKMPSKIALFEKNHMKYQKIDAIMKGIDYLPLHRPELYRMEGVHDSLPNNAWFMSYKRYRKEQVNFNSQLEAFHGDLRLFINAIKRKY